MPKQNGNIILVKKESCLYLHLKRMKLCGIFMAYQRLCVSCFGAHQQPIQEQHGGTSSTVHSTLESVLFLKKCPTVKIFF